MTLITKVYRLFFCRKLHTRNLPEKADKNETSRVFNLVCLSQHYLGHNFWKNATNDFPQECFSKKCHFFLLRLKPEGQNRPKMVILLYLFLQIGSSKKPSLKPSTKVYVENIALVKYYDKETSVFSLCPNLDSR